MSLKDEERKTIVRFRLENARTTFAEVRLLLDNSLWRTAANRLYYACYYAASALLIQKGIETHTHNGVINQFGLHFVSKGIISIENGKFYKNLFELRQTGDYSDWVVINETDVKPLVVPAENFIKTIEKLILTK